MNYDIDKIRDCFPILKEKPYGKKLVYLDNSATTQKPSQVTDTINDIYNHCNSNIHRGVHYLSGVMTEKCEDSRKTIQKHIFAEFSQEIIFTAGTTAGINAVAFSFGERYIKPHDEIIVSAMEHHANIVPWQMMCDRKKAVLRVIPVSDEGLLDMDAYEKLLSEKTRIVAVCHGSNTLGTVNPIKKMAEMAHKCGAAILVDGAQTVQHMPVNVKELDCDFYVFSGHKMYGPTGIGVLYGKRELLLDMPPYQGGGSMVECVNFEKTTYNELPFKFEAGTPNYTGAIALGTAIEFINNIGINNIRLWEDSLTKYATGRLAEIPDIKIYGTTPDKIGVISFLMGKSHPYDVGMILDKLGIAVRTGTHCAQPIMHRYGISGTLRVSFGLYNTKEEIDILYEALIRAGKILS